MWVVYASQDGSVPKLRARFWAPRAVPKILRLPAVRAQQLGDREGD